MQLQLRNPFLRLLKADAVRAKSNLFTPPKASLDIFTDGVKIDIDAILKKSPYILGQAGSGKSTGVGRLLEEVLQHEIQIFLEDFAGEHLGIAEMFKEQFVVLNLPVDAVQAAHDFVKSGKSYYLDCSGVDRKLYMEFFAAFLEEVYNIKKSMPDNERKPSLFVFEEAHNFIPEWPNPSDPLTKIVLKVKEYLRKFATEGRKFGCPSLHITQRPSLADKTILSQSRMGIHLKVTFPNDVKTYCLLVPGSNFRGLRMQLFKMQVGQCIVVMDGKVVVRRFKKKRSKDYGNTPGFAEAKGWVEGRGIAQT